MDTASTAAADQRSRAYDPGGIGSLGQLPPHPGENTQLHIATEWVEQAERGFSAAGLLSTANGSLPRVVQQC